MKYIIKNTVTLSFCTTLAFAGLFDSSDVWKNGEIESKDNSNLIATIFLSGDNQLKIGIKMPSDDCTGFGAMAMEAPAMNFNGTVVKMYAQCLSSNVRMDFPQSNAGVNYITNEFNSKKNVIVSQDGYSFTFSTNGFKKEYQIQTDKAIEESNGI